MNSAAIKKIGDALVQIGVYMLTAVLIGKTFTEGFSAWFFLSCFLLGVIAILGGARLVGSAKKMREHEDDAKKF